jgi:hypothetical protein
MKFQHQIETSEKIEFLLASLERDIKQLELTIAAEENLARQYNASNYAYPFTARMMATRRDNLRATVAALESRLESRSSILVG